MALVHGTCVDLGGVAVLLRGPPGSGKSDLALRLIDEGARLIADDGVAIEAAEGRLMARVPEAIAGMMEVRGLGLMRVQSQPEGCLGLVVDLVEPWQVERLPDLSTCEIEGVQVMRVGVAPFEASACAKVRLAARITRDDIKLDK